MERLDKDVYFLFMARFAALRGTCARRTVGCILVDSKYYVLATGYNGVPSGEEHCTDKPCAGAKDPSGDTSRCRAIHAERNAVQQLLSRDLISGLSVPLAAKVARAYVSVSPCLACAKYMWKHCRRLEEVHVVRAYPDSGAKYLEDRKVRVFYHEHLLELSTDRLFDQMERFR